MNSEALIHSMCHRYRTPPNFRSQVVFRKQLKEKSIVPLLGPVQPNRCMPTAVAALQYLRYKNR